MRCKLNNEQLGCLLGMVALAEPVTDSWGDKHRCFACMLEAVTDVSSDKIEHLEDWDWAIDTVEVALKILEAEGYC